MECKEVLVRLWEYLDEELTPEEAKGIAAHLRRCPQCHPACRYDRAFLELVARQRAACTAPSTLLLAIRLRLKRV